jgi:phosphatidylinositol alpha-1,6-mannosyltransferase
MPASDQSQIFLITHEFFPRRGGIATFSEQIALASAGLGHDVEVWAQSSEEPEKSWPFRMRRLPLRGSHDLICQFRLGMQLIRERRRLRHATVYLPEPGPMLAMMLVQNLRTFRPHRLMLTFHGSEILKFARNPLTRFLCRRLIHRATRISTLSKYTQSLLRWHFPEVEGKLFLTPGALRTDFAVVPSERGRKDGRLIVLTVGRLHPRKGQLLTLQALQALAPEFRRNLEYWIVGGQSKENYESRLREEASRSDLQVRFFGNVPDDELEKIYAQADLFAMTSVNHGPSIEGFGLVYLEAAAQGLPIVAHDVGGVSEAVLDGQTGFLVPPNRPAQLCAAFEKLIADPDLRRRMGESGRQWAGRHRWEQSAEALFGLPHSPATTAK